MRRSVILLLALALVHSPQARAQRLRLVHFTSDTSSFNVGSTLILGPTEAILVDAQYHWADAQREADSIARLGTHLKAIFITHGDEDHYMGASAFVERFPGTPVYMTAAGITWLKRIMAPFMARQPKDWPPGSPDSLVTPQLLPSTSLTVDGEQVEIVADQQGDAYQQSNSFVWIPSLKAVLADDIVFNQVHPWLAASDTTTRQRWHQSLVRIAALHPRIVIASHKKSPDTPDRPDVVQAMDRYLSDFDAALKASPNADALVAAMKAKYPDYAIPVLLLYSARSAFAPRRTSE